ncbi:MAG: tetratricopeptide repeat protein [Deltaproteobacteria bacterium]|nr:tetratricopeptide repeat protein [Deltaproteobacteria bacterium]
MAGYLARFPEGRAVAGVAAALARAEAAAGETAEAERHWQLVLERAPRSPLAAEALTKLGRALLAAGRFDDAAALFEPFATADAGPLAETGLVGLAHARAGQGRWEAVKALAALYTSRFPGGRRGAEMEALAARAGAP